MLVRDDGRERFMPMRALRSSGFLMAGCVFAAIVFATWSAAAAAGPEKKKGPWPDKAQELTPQGWADEDPRWSPDGRLIAYRTFQYGRADIFAVDPEGKRKNPLLMSLPKEVDARWLDTSEALVYAQTSSGRGSSVSIDGIFRFDPKSGQTTAFAKEDSAWLAWSVSGDGRAVIAAGSRTKPDRHFFLRKFDARTGAFTEVSLFFPTGMMYVQELALSLDGTECAILAETRDRARDVFVVSLAGPEEKVLRLTDDGQEKKSLLWSPRGRRLLFLVKQQTAAQDGKPGNRQMRRVKAYGLAVISADGKGRPELLSGNDRSADTPVWHPDGKHIVYAAGLGARWELFVADTESKKTAKLTGGEWRDFAPSCSPDGRTIVFVSDRAGDRDLFLLPFRGE